MKELWAEKLKEKLQGHEAEQIPEDLWAGIEKELNAAEQTVPFYKKKYTWSAAAVVLLIILGGSAALYLQKDSSDLVAETTEILLQETSVQEIVQKDESVPVKAMPTQAPAKATKKTQLTFVQSKYEEETAAPETESQEPLKEAEPNETESQEKENAVTVETAPSKKQEESHVFPPTDNYRKQQPTGKSRNSKKITLAFTASGINPPTIDLRGGDFDDLQESINPGDQWSDQMTGSPGDKDKDKDKDKNQNQGISAPILDKNQPLTRAGLSKEDPVVEENHRRPITIGLQVGIPVSAKWWLTTGLSYTYMKSEIRHRSGKTSMQELHFVGIPASLNYSLYKDEKWHIYAGAGGRMDMGKTVYFSLSATPGIQYQLKNGLSLYAEPALQYNLPSSEKFHTYFTTHKWMGDLHVGLRWTIGK